MRIESSQRIAATSPSRRRSGSSDGGGFSVSGGEEKAATQKTSAATSLAGIDALMMLQEVDERGERKRRALKRGHDLLDLLESVKLDLIAGIDNPAALTRLGDLVRRHRQLADDPQLASILDEIELRAAVELAKRGLNPGLL
ncbi:flagellar assembly protein FliX [Tepidamorphus sp. 3E244]|uniref:flagellar assembly protein FliX n=1 Tax=Tepidamorphus sp. 3E244 TaxID=3385498 RepID=UPI0038FC37BD